MMEYNYYIHKLVPFQPLYYAGMFLFLCGWLDKAREYVDRMLKLNPEHEEGLVVKAWLELAAGRESQTHNIMEYFDAVLQRLCFSLMLYCSHSFFFFSVFPLPYI